MSEDKRKENDYRDTIGRKEERKIEAQRDKRQTVLFGLGMFGLVGWSVAIPTVVATAVGVWIDNRYASPYSWTLMLMIAGVIVGCLNAWYWIRMYSRPFK